ncbi:MAG: sigma factor-like helix-turn-helix DNA-binding protein [Acidobacteriota bacterium]|nr:sigma factor-like helix-turn-helix DNA-binding protein [Acidobacteriota bacterium]
MSERARFKTTLWSMVVAAGDSQNPRFHDELAILCENYWYPVYAFVRRRGANADHAQDLAQGFFPHILEKGTLKAADRDRGRFRSFLLTALKFYLSDEYDRATAKKRGGGQEALSLDMEDAESRYKLEAEPEGNPDRIFAKRWALEVLDHTHRKPHAEFEEGANPERARRLSIFLSSDGDDISYREVGEELDMSESAVKVAVHRMRKRFGGLLRDEVARPVVDPTQIDRELRFLLSAIE